MYWIHIYIYLYVKKTFKKHNYEQLLLHTVDCLMYSVVFSILIRRTMTLIISFFSLFSEKQEKSRLAQHIWRSI